MFAKEEKEEKKKNDIVVLSQTTYNIIHSTGTQWTHSGCV